VHETAVQEHVREHLPDIEVFDHGARMERKKSRKMRAEYQLEDEHHDVGKNEPADHAVIVDFYTEIFQGPDFRFDNPFWHPEFWNTID